ncbi:hypothetical protein J0A67_15800 [Algoriphagus aestuariicola]|jgi:hypothetical protein|uniref:Uncharacterized protein n=1 Tax=Algoriphagus aestuariicola TaxID=1852016 RepID=A0ABS3BSQ5_9BACT|nr:hypothetical protein [Algoriphagus aestuariicola]MBN7802338.1 hypothetical protein [Algoriphagus aestuariicola]
MLSSHLSKGMQISMEDTGAEEGLVVCRVDQGFPLSEKVKVVSLREFLDRK